MICDGQRNLHASKHAEETDSANARKRIVIRREEGERGGALTQQEEAVPEALSQEPEALSQEKPSPCSFGLSTSGTSLRTNKPPAISQQYFSLRTNQHQPSATSQTNKPHVLITIFSDCEHIQDGQLLHFSCKLTRPQHGWWLKSFSFIRLGSPNSKRALTAGSSSCMQQCNTRQ
jgi:hypothetical protein